MAHRPRLSSTHRELANELLYAFTDSPRLMDALCFPSIIVKRIDSFLLFFFFFFFLLIFHADLSRVATHVSKVSRHRYDTMLANNFATTTSYEISGNEIESTMSSRPFHYVLYKILYYIFQRDEHLIDANRIKKCSRLIFCARIKHQDFHPREKLVFDI